ncbi:MAG: DUF2278 family protein [Candidatus Xenobia bacterium]
MDSVQSALPRFVSHRGQGQFADIVGEFDHEVDLGGHGEPHARFDMNVNGDTYEADINVHSVRNPDGSSGGSDVEYAIQDQVVPSMPADGVHAANFSYADQGLQESNFKTVDSETFHQQLEQLASQSSRIELLGMTYHDANKNGIHDIHMNSGEDGSWQNHPNEDGAAKFYIQGNDGQIHCDTVYIKFQSQHLPQ